jgi:hypothetical protein
VRGKDAGFELDTLAGGNQFLARTIDEHGTACSVHE